MSYRVYLAEPPSLLDDLLEDSSRLFHNRCAVVQRVFHQKWLSCLGERIAREQIERPNDPVTKVEERARRRLRPVWEALREGKREMIREEREAMQARDKAIREYIATRQDCAVVAA